MIHRDIKPENILLQDGHALVADFGIALAVQQAGGPRMTQTGLSLGTPQYMSPEQAMGERTIDARSDIYALGAVTYEMLAGDPPFTGSSVQAIVAKVLTEKPTPLRTVRDTVPEAVEHAVLTALAKLPADRFATAAEFATALTSPSAERPAEWAGASPIDSRCSSLFLPRASSSRVALPPGAGCVSRPRRRRSRASPSRCPRTSIFSHSLGICVRRLAKRRSTRVHRTGAGQGHDPGLDSAARRARGHATREHDGRGGVRWSPDAHFLAVMASQRVTSVVSADGGRVVSLARTGTRAGARTVAIYFVDRRTPGSARDRRRNPGHAVPWRYRRSPRLPTTFPHGDGALFAARRRADEASESDIVAVTSRPGRRRWSVPACGRASYPGRCYSFAEGNVFIVPFDQSAGR